MDHTHTPSRDRSSRKSIWSLIILALLFAGLTGYLALHRLTTFGASQVSAAPPPSAPVTPAALVPESTTLGPRRVQVRVLDAGTGQPLRGASLWSGRRELLTDEEGRFTVDLGAGQSPAV